MTAQPTSFNITEKMMKLKSKEGMKDYLPVQWRVAWFREICPNGSIETEEILVDLDREVEEETSVWNKSANKYDKVIKHGKGYARFRASITDGQGGKATGTKSENAAGFPDYIEKAETGSIGRALAALGYGTQYVGNEFDEGLERIVDSPVTPSPSSPPTQPPHPSSSSSKASTPSPVPPLVTKPTPVPAQRDEPKKVKLATSEQIAEISDAAHILGPFEWRQLLPVSRLPEDTSQWSFDQATMFLKKVSDWTGSETQKAWLAGKADKAQMDEITRFRSKEQYGGNAVASLKSRIEGLKEVSSTDFTHEQADMLLNYLYTAKPVIEQAKRIDPANNVVTDFKGITHPLDFYAVTRKPGEGTLEDYLKQLNEIEAKQAA